MISHISEKQRTALEWLAKSDWEASWWGGKPHGCWPREMDGRTYASLLSRGLVLRRNGARWPKCSVEITDAGRAYVVSGQSSMMEK